MPHMTSREIQLVSRPSGLPVPANFTLVQTTLAPLQDQEVLVRNLFMSVDPYMRGRMNEGKSYVPQFEIGKPLEGGAVGEVVESRAKEFKTGDIVTSSLGENSLLSQLFRTTLQSAKQSGVRELPDILPDEE